MQEGKSFLSVFYGRGPHGIIGALGEVFYEPSASHTQPLGEVFHEP